ncbi:hypothetical protein [Bradyrhizobium sp. STM 3843]|uniref:hypothetical protein n=1 Tax=Bradyrhizobium sp. STM 3843 TaxID=551947 RepID=UPI001112AC1E|nr:hypothetical protein [Bradyrhizobium sp. STM 3843]
MSDFLLTLPEDFDRHEWATTAKGWFTGAQLTVSGKTYSLTFYDPVRLSQEIRDEFSCGNDCFFEQNLIVVRSVTRSAMERAAAFLVQSGQARSLLQIEPSSSQ